VSIERSYFSAKTDTVLGGLRTFSPLVIDLGGGASGAGRQYDPWYGAGHQHPCVIFSDSAQHSGINHSSLQMVGANLERVSDVLNTEPEQAGQEIFPAPRLTGSIELRNVSFQYDP